MIITCLQPVQPPCMGSVLCDIVGGIVLWLQGRCMHLQVPEEEESSKGGVTHEAHPQGHDAQRSLPLL